MAVTPFESFETETGTWRFFMVPSPSWPNMLSPQHITPPSISAHVCRPPAAMAETPDVRPMTATGVRLCALEPFPSWPEPLSPQHQTAPVVDSAQVCRSPAATAAIGDVRPMTGTGSVVAVVAEPFPSCPSRLPPQHWTPPDMVTAQVWLDPRESPPPAVMAETPDVRPVTGAGTLPSIVEPLPSWPCSSSPQHQTAPIEVSKQ